MFKTAVAGILLLFFVGVFITLGVWQLQRLEWKNTILAQIDAQEAIDPKRVAIDFNRSDNYQRGFITGRFLNKSAIKLSPRTNDKGEVGYHILYPFQVNGGPVVLVNIGWFQGETYPVMSGDQMKIVGYMRLPTAQGGFTPDNRPDNGLWYRADVSQIEKFYSIKNIHPMVFYQMTGVDAQGFHGIPRPRNKHMQYAIFWFSSAFVLTLLSGWAYYRRRSR